MTPTSPVTLSRESQDLADALERIFRTHPYWRDFEPSIPDRLARIEAASRAVTETPEGLDAAWEAVVAALPVGGRLTAIFETWDADMRRTGHVGLKRTRQEAAEGLNWLATRLTHKEEHGG